MELTGLMNRIGDLRGSLQSFALPIGILALIAMMVMPLPSLLIDTFFVFNILLSLLILMVAMNAKRPLDFSSFPNLLLLATILRLALNVASTRIILAEGHNGPDAAGLIIKAFGDFVVSGNYVVGIFVFIILVIINLVVITKGSGRVSEVAARFTLDAMPGKQMAIDADLNAGILTPEEATARRKEIGEEAELLADTQQGGALGALFLRDGRVAVGQAHRAEQNGIGAAAQLERGVGQGLARGVDAGPADGRLGDVELQGKLVAHGTEDAQGLPHDFRADAIASQRGDPISIGTHVRGAVCEEQAARESAFMDPQ
jgi:hypothetical protein